MWNTKMLMSTFSAIMLALSSVGTPFSTHAEETETTMATETSTVAETTENTTIQLDDEDMQELVDEIQNGDFENENNDLKPDYYAEDYYDTAGNATLIKHEKIIYDSEEMQFIAVTTKDGNVFYVLINYSAEGDEDNVFFLNKVDDFDLYSLLYAGNESEEGQDPQERAELYANAAIGGNTTENSEETTEATETKDSLENVSQPSSQINQNMLIIGSMAVLVIGGVAFFVLKSGKKKNKTNIPDDDYDEDFDEEE